MTAIVAQIAPRGQSIDAVPARARLTNRPLDSGPGAWLPGCSIRQGRHL